MHACWICRVLFRAQANQGGILTDLDEMERDDPEKWLEGFGQYCETEAASKPGRKKKDVPEKNFDFAKLFQSRCLCCENDCDCVSAVYMLVDPCNGWW